MKHDAKPRLELLEGGLSGDDADWRGFCDRIGWQLDEPALPEDYEARLAARIFAPSEDVVALADERALAGDVRGGARRAARDRRWAWLAAAALLVLLAASAWALTGRSHRAPPAARTVPTPVPERTPVPSATATAEPSEEEPPDPGSALAQRAPVERPSPRRDRARVDRRGTGRASRTADAPSGAAVAPEGSGAAPSGKDVAPPGGPSGTASVASGPAFISPDADPPGAAPAPPAPRTAVLPARPRLPPAEVAVRHDERPSEEPAWEHVGVAGGGAGDGRRMAVVDVLAMGRDLRGAL